MSVILSEKTIALLRARADARGLDVETYLERLIAADAENEADDERLAAAIAEGLDDEDEPWDMEEVRRSARAAYEAYVKQ